MIKITTFILCITTLAQAPIANANEFPQMLLGKGMIGHLNTECKDSKAFHKDYPKLETTEDVKRKCLKEKNEILFLALECVGHDSTGQLTCSQVQPVLMSITQNSVIQRGLLQTVSTHDGQPTDQEIKTFVRNMNRQFKDYRYQHETKLQQSRSKVIAVLVGGIFVGGIIGLSAITGGTGVPLAIGGLAVTGGSFFLANGALALNSGYRSHPEQIDTQSYNWSQDQRKVRPQQFKDFSALLLDTSNNNAVTPTP